MCTEEKEALGQACQVAETVMHTVMQIPQSSEPYEEQEKKKISKTSLVNYRHRRWCPAVSSFMLVLIPFGVATPGRRAYLFYFIFLIWGSSWAQEHTAVGKAARKGEM